jgi:transmembrane sensor
VENNVDITNLLRGHIAGNLSDDEKLRLFQFLDNPDNLHKGNELIAKLFEETASHNEGYNEEDVERIIRSILDYSHYTAPRVVVHHIHFLKSAWFRYAAAVLIFMSISAYFYYRNASREIVYNLKSAPVNNDVLPGSHKAILTLSDGRKVELNPGAKQIITDGKLAINNSNGTVAYANSEFIAYNTMSTPNGGQYKLTLPDGTRVWLNAASSITFPTSFQGNNRIVSIDGEAYFEVTKNPLKPFTVKTHHDEIRVLGTSFNVNSYTNEPAMKTSLLEGAVHIGNIVLKAGEAYLNGSVVQTDLDQDLAWKNDVFNFHHIKLTDAMRQIARWYDIKVSYKGKFTEVELGGEIGMNLTLQQLLSGLQDKELHFELSGKTLTVIQQ